MLAIDSGCDTALIDYLLSKAVSPAENDQIRGCVCQVKGSISL